MPRPGPRPYECVRKAWHSERHQPIRGSLIQEIFRVVNEVHSSPTKKNKEWQEKLPVVVLKAEEIMYSKANSEAEYMDLKTLWDRASDAINTIIRRDETAESTENGKPLQPCIEAALHLGCTARRASRSQRNSSPRTYLSPSTQEPPIVSPGKLENPTRGDHIINSQYLTHCPNFVKPTTLLSSHPNPVAQNNDCNNQCLSMENYPASNFYSVYPLFYGHPLQFEEPQHGFRTIPKLTSNPLEPAKMGDVGNNLSCSVDASYKITETNRRDSPENPCKIGCDLSLRLGPLSVSCLSVGNSQLQEVVGDVGSSSSRERSKFSDQSPQVDKNFSFFHRGNASGPLDSSLSKRSFEGKYSNLEAMARKRKAFFRHPAEDWQPKLPCSHLPGSMRNAGL